MQNVSLYVRHHGTRKYELAKPKFGVAGGFPMGTIFVLRYQRNGKRCFETLPEGTNGVQALIIAKRRELELFTGEYVPPAPKPAPKTKPVVATDGGSLMLDAAIDRYLENVTTKSAHTSHGYSYTLKQFYQSCGNKPLPEISKQDLYGLPARRETKRSHHPQSRGRRGRVLTAALKI